MNALVAATVLTLAAGALTGCGTPKPPGRPADPADAVRLGVPLYPGALARDPGTVVLPDGTRGQRIVARFTTRDVFDTVEAFYARALGRRSERSHLVTPSGSLAVFEAAAKPPPGRVLVQITTDKPRQTDILITHRLPAGS